MPLLCAALISMLTACSAPSGSAAPEASPTAGAEVPSPTSPTAAATPGPTAVPVAGCVAKPADMVAWWRAEGDATDAAGSNDGTLKEGATFGAGLVGKAFTFDGTSQYVEVSGAPDLQLTTAITIEGWIYAAGAQAGYAGIAGTWDDNSGANRTYLFWLLNGQLDVVISPDGGTYQRASDPTPIPLDTWVHVAATYDGAAIRLYRDGVEVASTDYPGGIGTNQRSFLIGRTEGGSVGPNFWHGSIDELAVYGRALSPAEIAAIHAAGSAGKCP
jgi:hypothetical protein